MYKILLTLFVASILMACGQGPTGLTGATGPAGPQGGSCSAAIVSPSNTAPNGGSLIQCADGTQSLILNGIPGTPGTVIAPIQFCKNPVTSYPTTFVEIGFCISGEIYAVYSANDGFLSPIPNGNYTSDGINASCNFTVTGCTISNQSN